MRTLRVIVVGMLLLTGTAGCLPLFITAASTAGIAYIAGDLVSKEPYSVDTLWVASMDTINSLEMVPVTRQKDEVRGRLLARGAEGRHVLIQLERWSDRETSVKIRVGTFGDEVLSRFILDRIRAFAER